MWGTVSSCCFPPCPAFVDALFAGGFQPADFMRCPALGQGRIPGDNTRKFGADAGIGLGVQSGLIGRGEDAHCLIQSPVMDAGGSVFPPCFTQCPVGQFRHESGRCHVGQGHRRVGMKARGADAFYVLHRQRRVIEIKAMAHPFDHAGNFIIYRQLAKIERHQSIQKPAHDDEIDA